MTLLYVLIALQVADVVTTLYALRLGAREANPALAWLIKKCGPYSIVVLKIAFIGLIYFQKPEPWGLAILLAMYVFVVVNNIIQTNKQRRLNQGRM